jgi:hypothetical protein
MQTDKGRTRPAIMGHIKLDPENPSEITREMPLQVKTTEDKIFLNFNIADVDKLKPGTYTGKLNLLPSQKHFGALVIEPSQLNVEFKKSGFIGFYAWKALLAGVAGLFLLFYVTNKVKRRMPIKV